MCPLALPVRYENTGFASAVHWTTQRMVAEWQYSPTCATGTALETITAAIRRRSRLIELTLFPAVHTVSPLSLPGQSVISIGLRNLIIRARFSAIDFGR